MPKFIDLTGQKFNRLTVIEKIGKKRENILWKCECECGNYINLTITQLKRGYVQSCGCIGNETKSSNMLYGKKIGKLTVLDREKDKILPSGRKVRIWKCVCECGNERNVYESRLGKICSCEKCVVRNYKTGKRKENEYEKNGKFTFMKLEGTDKKVIFDTDMLPILEKYYWKLNSHGYVCSFTDPKNKGIRMHQLIIGEHNGDVIDHINRNRLDNRKENLRVTTYEVNAYNRTMRKDNKYNCKGIRKENNKYRVQIVKNGKNIHLGYFDTLEDAIKARKDAEKIYHPLNFED